MSGDDLQGKLSALTKDELEQALARICRRYPDAIALLPAPKADEDPDALVDAIQADVARVLQEMGRDWRASANAARQIFPWVLTAKDHVGKGEHETALRLYSAVVFPILAVYEGLRDEESELARLVNECTQGVAACLARETGKLRRALIGFLFEIYRTDGIERGGYGMHEPAEQALTSHLTPDEQLQVAAAFTKSLQKIEGRHAAWRRQRVGRTVLALFRAAGHELKGDELVSLLADASLTRDLVAACLQRGDVDQALRALADAETYDLLDAADVLVSAGQQERAVQAVLLHKSVLESSSHRTRQWLKDHGAPISPQMEALIHALSVRRNFDTPARLRVFLHTAREADRIQQALELCLKELADKTRATLPARISALAWLGRFDEAIDLTEELSDSAWKPTMLDLARIASESQPSLSAELYEEILRRLGEPTTRQGRAEKDRILAELQAVRAL